MWWLWIIYVAIGFLVLGVVTTAMQEDDGSMTRNAWITAWIAFLIWPAILLMAVGATIGENTKDDSTKHD